MAALRVFERATFIARLGQLQSYENIVLTVVQSWRAYTKRNERGVIPHLRMVQRKRALSLAKRQCTSIWSRHRG